MPFDAMNQGKAIQDLKPKTWTLEMALELTRAMEPFAKVHGYSVMLAGSVLYKGEATKNLNLIFMPSGEPQAKISQDLQLLTWLGETLGQGTIYRRPLGVGASIYKHYMNYMFDGLPIQVCVG